MPKDLITLPQHIVDLEREHPGATGEFTSVLLAIAEVSKLIRQRVVNAGLVDILGETGAIKRGETLLDKLPDVVANHDNGECHHSVSLLISLGLDKMRSRDLLILDNRSRGTIQIASKIIPFDILEEPSIRSIKMMGSSFIR